MKRATVLSRLLSLSICLCLLLTMLPAAVKADSTDRVIYFVNAGNWSTVKAYTWNNGTQHLGGWPGSTMTKVDGQEKLYCITVPADAVNIIFNSGSTQTADLVVPAESTGLNMYDYVSDKWSTYTPKVEEPTVEPTIEPTAAPTLPPAEEPTNPQVNVWQWIVPVAAVLLQRAEGKLPDRPVAFKIIGQAEHRHHCQKDRRGGRNDAQYHFGTHLPGAGCFHGVLPPLFVLSTQYSTFFPVRQEGLSGIDLLSKS